MNRQNYRRYETWTTTQPFGQRRRWPRRGWDSSGPDLDDRTNQFMGSTPGKLLAALGLGLLVGLGYTLIFGLSFVEGALFMFLCSALSIGINLFLKHED